MTNIKEEYLLTCMKNLFIMNNLLILKLERSLKQINQFEYQSAIEENPHSYTIDMRHFDSQKDNISMIREIAKNIDEKLETFEIAQLFGIADIETHL